MRSKFRPNILTIGFVIVAAVGLWLAVAGNGSSEIVYEADVPDWQWSGASFPDQYMALLSEEDELSSAQAALPDQVWHQTRDSLQELLADGNTAAIVAYLGEAPTGGYAIRIRAVHVHQGSDRSVTIIFARRRPAPDEFVTGAFTYPYEIVPIPRNQLPDEPFAVQFIDDQGRSIDDGLRAVIGRLPGARPNRTPRGD